jgi:hypothetical protein
MNTQRTSAYKSVTMALALVLVLASGVFCPLLAASLSDQETAALLFMREEEKLARDVYVQMYQKWKLPIFKNISKSEQTHMDAIKALLDRYGLLDPAAEMGIGQYQNADLQTLYQKLLQVGAGSLRDALEVGVAIEEVDIDDLTEAIAITTHNDIRRVCTNLRQASFQHRESFQRLLAAR